ncbi:MAG: CoA ester lyase [Alphaproteobacteria bacterium]|nr:CoA ester lyase [Alphaproteobacteria bacterium]
MSDFRPLRSVLYIPAANARALEKAKTLPADALIFDLEDAVAPDAKAAAREQACGAAKAGGYGKREIVIRANGLDTPWGQADIAAAAQSGADAILIPKVESAAQVNAAESAMARAGAPAGMPLWCMMETPLGILRAEEVAKSSPRMTVLVAGTSDLTKDLRARHMPDRMPMQASLGLLLLAGRAYGKTVLDGVHLDLDDEAGFVAQCEQGLSLGFDGKTLIHPKQVEPCNAVFAPKPEEVVLARRIIEVFAEAERAGKGVVLVDGKLIENLHVANARRTLAIAEAIAARAG